MPGLSTRWRLAVLLCALSAGCAAEVTRFNVIDYRTSGQTERFFQTFDHCYYCRDAHDNLDIVARLTSTDGGPTPTTQTVHIHAFWIPRPGRTAAERTMINATVSYVIQTGPTGATFEGSGFVTFKENRAGDRIVGELELASLTPQRRLGDARRLFERAQLSGTIVAQRDRARVVSTLNEIKRLFGPLPEYDASTGVSDIR